MELEKGYQIHDYINHQTSDLKKGKIEKLDSISIIRAYCYMFGCIYEHIACSCYYCNLHYLLRKVVFESKEQYLFNIINLYEL